MFQYFKNLILIFILLAIFYICLPTISNAKWTSFVSKEDKAIAKVIMDLSKKKKWFKYRQLWKKIHNPILKKALLWYQLKSPNSGAKFQQISNFLIRNPDWPQGKRLQIRAEEVLHHTKKYSEVIGWFKDRIPLTPNGAEILANSYVRSKDISSATELIQRMWVFGNFGRKQETQFYKQFRRFMTRKNHIERLDRLLWEGKYYPARRMYRRMNADYRALAEARLSLRRMSGGVDRAIESPTIFKKRCGFDL